VGSNPTLNIIIIFSKILNSFEYQISNQIDVAQFKRKRKVTKSLHYITLETKREWAQFTVKYVWGYSEIDSFETWPDGSIRS
jgi:hypothetical protein